MKILGWLMILAGVLVGIAGLTGFTYFSGKFQHPSRGVSQQEEETQFQQHG